MLRTLLPKAKATGRWSSNEIARAAAGGMARVRVLKEIGDDEILDKTRKALKTWPHDLFELRFRNPVLFISFCRPGLEHGSAEARDWPTNFCVTLVARTCGSSASRIRRTRPAEGKTCAVVNSSMRSEPRYLAP